MMTIVDKGQTNKSSDPIDRKSPIPFYIQLKDIIRDKIEKGEWRPGDKIPGEAELGEVFDISRTVNSPGLCRELMYEGLIDREKGRGNVCCETQNQCKSCSKADRFSSGYGKRGIVHHSQVLKQALVPASTKVAEYLKLSRGTPVIEIQRLRFIGDEPIILATTYLPIPCVQN